MEHGTEYRTVVTIACYRKNARKLDVRGKRTKEMIVRDNCNHWPDDVFIFPDRFWWQVILHHNTSILFFTRFCNVFVFLSSRLTFYTFTHLCLLRPFKHALMERRISEQQQDICVVISSLLFARHFNLILIFCSLPLRIRQPELITYDRSIRINGKAAKGTTILSIGFIVSSARKWWFSL